jgi:hypothetical protein
MKIKISRNVIHGGKILQAGAVHEISEEHAELLIGGGHAEKADGKTPKPRTAGAGDADVNTGTRGELMAKKYPELLAIVEAWNKENPAKKITVGPNCSKQDLVALIMGAAGYRELEQSEQPPTL